PPAPNVYTLSLHDALPISQIFRLIAEHQVTHLCGAPIVLNMLAHAPADQRVQFRHTVTIATGGAAPPSAVFRSMEALGFRVTHLDRKSTRLNSSHDQISYA